MLSIKQTLLKLHEITGKKNTQEQTNKQKGAYSVLPEIDNLIGSFVKLMTREETNGTGKINENKQALH